MVFWKNHSAPLALGALSPSVAWAQDRPHDWGWGMHPMGWMGGMWGLGMMIMMLIFWALILAAIVLALRWLLRQAENLATIQRWKFCVSAMPVEKSRKKNSTPGEKI